ncbi:MAG: hypothetical protein AAGI15_14470 [Pseudomonadota bacterium]
MDHQTLNEIDACLGRARRLLWYYPGRYALLRLAAAAAVEDRISQLKRRPEGALLNHRAVKPFTARSGDGRLCPFALRNHWQASAIPFALTLGRWGPARGGDWRQTSRAGYNLVLRLDLSEAHIEDLRRRFGAYDWLFNSPAHPVTDDCDRRRETLAWARLDLSFEHDEVLIEEIQSDWVRDASDAAHYGWHTRAGRISAADARRYLREVLEPISAIWQEAMLCAVLEFIAWELGIARVWYHDFATGNGLKRIRYDHPPRSLYRDLPRRFCMTKVDDAPMFLKEDRRARRVLKRLRPYRFFRLDLPEVARRSTPTADPEPIRVR